MEIKDIAKIYLPKENSAVIYGIFEKFYIESCYEAEECFASFTLESEAKKYCDLINLKIENLFKINQNLIEARNNFDELWNIGNPRPKITPLIPKKKWKQGLSDLQITEKMRKEREIIEKKNEETTIENNKILDAYYDKQENYVNKYLNEINFNFENEILEFFSDFPYEKGEFVVKPIILY